MTYPGTGITYSHFRTAGATTPNLKGFNFDLSTAPTTARTLTGAASTDRVLWVSGIKFLSAAGAQPKLSMPTIAYSLGTASIKFSNGMSNMAVFGAWIDENA